MKRYGAKIKLGLLALGLMVSHVTMPRRFGLVTRATGAIPIPAAFQCAGSSLSKIHTKKGKTTSEMKKLFQDHIGGTQLTLVNLLGLNPLMHAAYYGDVGLLESVLANTRVTDVHLKQKYNFGQVNRGVQMRSTAIIREHGDPFFIGFRKRAPKATPCGNFLNDLFGNMTVLHLAAQKGNQRIMDILLDRPGVKAMVNQADGKRRTSLHYAAEKGHVEVVKKLVKLGANPNNKDKAGLTPIHLAGKIKDASKRIFTIMALKNTTTLKGDKEALFTALKTGDKEFVELVLKFDAEMDVLDEKGRTPLLYALTQYAEGKSKFDAIIDLLRQRGALIKVGGNNYLLIKK